MATIEAKKLIQELGQWHRPEADRGGAGRHGPNNERNLKALSTAALSVGAGAAAAAGATTRRRRGRDSAFACHRKGGKHRPGVRALALRADLALVATGIATEDVEGVAAGKARELVDRHDHIVRMWANKSNATPSSCSTG